MTRLKRMHVPDEYKYLLERYRYSYARKLQDISFLLGKHFKDETDEYCNSEKIKKLLEDAIDFRIKYTETLYGVTAILAGDEMVTADKILAINKKLTEINVYEI